MALQGACVVGQSGGPTSVINASVYGVIEAALADPAITKVYAAAHGIVGVLEDQLYDMACEEERELKLLLQTPAAALGSCRYKLRDIQVDAGDYERILEVFQKYDIRYFFYIGGNDSMDTCHKITEYFARVGYECRVIGVPKTIDNDLFGTDHCPGYGSAAKYIATACMEISRDISVYDVGTVCVLEMMGRHAGWLTAAAALAGETGNGPDLIYLPEVDFDTERFLADVKRVFDEKGRCLIVVSEGVHDQEGKLIAQSAVDFASYQDAFGHQQLGGLAALLASLVKARLGVKVRGIEFSLLQRCAGHCMSKVDVQEAKMAGTQAVQAALEGETGKMVAFARAASGGADYACETCLLPLSEVANREKKIPPSWINAYGNGITPEFLEYARPLIQGEPELILERGLPRYASLKKVRSKR